MKKTLIAGIAGGVILFIWSFLAWVILPLHEPTLHKLPNEDAVIAALQSNATAKGIYLFPRSPGMSADKPTMDAWEQKLKRGPTGMLIYDTAGTDPFMTSQMASGFLLDILSALVVAWFLARSTAMNSSYLARVTYCGMFGVFVSVFTHLMSWNWMGFPMDYTIGLIIDGIVGLLLAGLAIAAIVKAPKTA